MPDAGCLLAVHVGHGKGFDDLAAMGRRVTLSDNCAYHQVRVPLPSFGSGDQDAPEPVTQPLAVATRRVRSRSAWHHRRSTFTSQIRP